MNIKADDMMELLSHLNDALGKDYQWMGYDAQLSKVSAKDIDCFTNKVEAENFYKDELKSDHSIVPIEPIWFIVQDLLILQSGNELKPMDIHINVPQVIQNFEKENQLLTTNINTMNEKNLEYLKDNLKYLGFGESLQRPLEQNISEGKTEFTLQHKATYNNQAMESTLHFKKGDQNEMYFFNKYDAKLLQPDERAQTFYLDKGNGVTTKEAFNLLNGRAVNKDLVSKEGEKYNAWVELDLSKKEDNGNYKLNRYHENYGYNLEKALQQYPLKELIYPTGKQDLIKSMYKGNLQSVEMEVKGKGETHYIQADPQYKDITIFNKNHTKLDRDQVSSLKAEAAQRQSTKQEAKQINNHKQAGGGDDDGPELKKKRTRKKGIAI